MILYGFCIVFLWWTHPLHLFFKINRPKQSFRHFCGGNRWGLLILLAYFECTASFLFNSFTLTGGFFDFELFFFFLFLQPDAISLKVFTDHFPRLVIPPSSLYFPSCSRLWHGQKFERFRTRRLLLTSGCNLGEINNILLCNYFIQI